MCITHIHYKYLFSYNYLYMSIYAVYCARVYIYIYIYYYLVQYNKMTFLMKCIIYIMIPSASCPPLASSSIVCLIIY